MVKITKYPQSCFLLDFDGTTVLIDPGSHMREKGFEVKNLPEIHIILITHKHGDHFDAGIVKQLLYRDGSAIITNPEVQQLLAEDKLECEILGWGESMVTEGLKIEGIESKHGVNPVVSGWKDPKVLGFKVSKEGKSVYHPGDTLHLKDKPKADVVLVPITPPVTMDPEVAAQFAREVGAKIAIPMHHGNNWDVDPKAFVELAEPNTAKILEDGESIEF